VPAFQPELGPEQTRVRASQLEQGPVWRCPTDSSAPVQTKQSMPAISAQACCIRNERGGESTCTRAYSSKMVGWPLRVNELQPFFSLVAATQTVNQEVSAGNQVTGPESTPRFDVSAAQLWMNGHHGGPACRPARNAHVFKIERTCWQCSAISVCPRIGKISHTERTLLHRTRRGRRDATVDQIFHLVRRQQVTNTSEKI
jgi:hypothetical protein